MTTRIENLWSDAFKGGLQVPIEFLSEIDNPPRFWERRVGYNFSDPCIYDYRHIATIQNLDRVIKPNGNKMFNVNLAPIAGADIVYSAVREALDPNIPNSDACQITANLIDYVDADDDVTVVGDISNYYFGFETPCIYISEIAQRFIHFAAIDVNAKSYAIELYKPYWEDHFPSMDPCDGWQLLITPSTGGPVLIPIAWSGSVRFHVIEFIDTLAPIDINFADVDGPNDINEPNSPIPQSNAYIAFSGGEFIQLQRRIRQTGDYLTVDWVWVPEPNDTNGWLKVFDVNDINEAVNVRAYSYQRDIGQGVNPHKCIRGKPLVPEAGLWSGDFFDFPLPSIGEPNPWYLVAEPYVAPYIIQAHPKNGSLTNIGEIGMLFRKEAYHGVTRADTDTTSKIDVNNPAYQRLFNYLTVIDPYNHGTDVNETRIKGRININTAPWFVIAQLPWVSERIGWTGYSLARSIVASRETVGPYQTIGQLNRVVTADPCSSIDFFARDGIDDGFPDLTPADGAADDFEERDVIFARISNLVTVRSDVFTAYILVRIGADGPQKRVVAILDRSGVTPAGGKVKVIAVQQVPEAR
jgi:hypothetical protein